VTFLRWLLAALLVVALVVSVGAVMAYVYGGATPVALVCAAAVAVGAWHGLRRLEPRSAALPELPLAESLFVLGLLGVVILLGILNLLLGLLALVVLHLLMRRAA